jgi:alkanesulfonate monooxygenase SsuD/methylene tetrahydromethanopterin reductase-like flavin-dependent oxidoreductase (luciferase family)
MSKTMKFALSWMPQSAKTSIDLAQAAERLGFVQFGIGDGPFLHQESYVTTAACLLNTERILGGPFVTNNVIRNWVTHASAARTFADLSPGRFRIGLAVGDGAVRSVGLRPMRWADLAQTTNRLREAAPDDLKIHVAVSGPKGAEVAGTFADVVVVMLGDAPVAINELADRARTAREKAGVNAPLEVWTMVSISVVPPGQNLQEARESKRAHSYSVAHFAFAETYEAKDVPVEWQGEIDERLARYDYEFHAVFTEDNPNHQLFADRPEIQEYLLDRMFWIGSPKAIQERFNRLIAATDLDGMWCSAHSVHEAEQLAAALGPALMESKQG